MKEIRQFTESDLPITFFENSQSKLDVQLEIKRAANAAARLKPIFETLALPMSYDFVKCVSSGNFGRIKKYFVNEAKSQLKADQPDAVVELVEAKAQQRAQEVIKELKKHQVSAEQLLRRFDAIDPETNKLYPNAMELYISEYGSQITTVRGLEHYNNHLRLCAECSEFIAAMGDDMRRGCVNGLLSYDWSKGEMMPGFVPYDSIG